MQTIVYCVTSEESMQLVTSAVKLIRVRIGCFPYMSVQSPILQNEIPN